MFQLTPKHAVPAKAPANESVQTTIVLHGLTAGLESLVQAYPYAASAKTYQATMESQQLDHSAQLAAEEEVADTLDKFAADHPRTGPLHVYVLGNPGAASFDQDNETTPMKALVNAALRNKSKVVAALMPEDASVFHVADIPPSLSLRQLAETVLTQESIPVLVGKAAFESFIKDPSGYLRRLDRRSRVIPTLESKGEMIFAGSLFGALAALNVGFWVHDKLKAWKHNRTMKGLPESDKRKLDSSAEVRDAITQLKHNYGNPTWYDKQTFVEGEISGRGIRSRMLSGDNLTHEPAIAVDRHIAAVHENFGKIVGAVDAYAKKVNPIAEEMIKKFNAGASSKEATAWAESQLKKVHDPLEGISFNLKGMLGSPEVVHDDYEWELNFSWHKHKYGGSPEPESKIPALTKDQAKAAGAALVKVLETVVDYMTNWSYDDQPWDIYDLAKKVGSSPEDAERFDDLWEHMIDSVSEHYWHHDLDRKYDNLRYFMLDSLTEVAIGLERWIHRSIVNAKK